MRNWLIRTTNNIILGPISEKKLKLLIKKGSLESHDEICSGNGYWIALKEKQLVNKYLYLGIDQGFNPIYHEVENEVDHAANADELDIVDHNNTGIHADGEASNATTIIKQDDLDKLIAAANKKRAPAGAGFLSGLVLKIIIIALVGLALSLLYFRNSILDGIFS